MVWFVCCTDTCYNEWRPLFIYRIRLSCYRSRLLCRRALLLCQRARLSCCSAGSSYITCSGMPYPSGVTSTRKTAQFATNFDQ